MNWDKIAVENKRERRRQEIEMVKISGYTPYGYTLHLLLYSKANREGSVIFRFSKFGFDSTHEGFKEANDWFSELKQQKCFEDFKDINGRNFEFVGLNKKRIKQELKKIRRDREPRRKRRQFFEVISALAAIATIIFGAQEFFENNKNSLLERNIGDLQEQVKFLEESFEKGVYKDVKKRL